MLTTMLCYVVQQHYNPFFRDFVRAGQSSEFNI